MAPHFTIAEASALLAAKKLSPVELTQICLDRVAKLDPVIHAFILQTPERALTEARAAEARIMAGRARGPLDGIPIAHKDIYCTAGLPTTAHSKVLKDHVPTENAHTVNLLDAAGTVMLGKLSTHEFAMGGPSFDLPWPPARNPWNPAHFTSGSSSGTGAGVAAGLFLGGTGSDTGGSIRGPAALCGIAGIKPTYGRCSRRGVLPLSYTLDHTGPMAWTAEDCAMLLQAMAGHDPADPASAAVPVPDYRANLHQGAKGLRIGVVRNFHETDVPANPAVRNGIDAAVATFHAEGAEIRDVVLPSLEEYRAAGFIILIVEAYAAHEPWLKTRLADYGELLRDRLVLGGLLSSADYFQAVRRRRELCLATAAAMADVDLLLTTASATEAPPIEGMPKWASMEKPGFTMPFNLTGLPAMSICAGYGEGGLPVSIQLIGKAFAEPTVLRAAHAFETATAWRQKRPAMAQ
jgi:aspartyl-tRNA(Asn)/glutamyl-tRNA(Gln) amidotransferase subunit A